MRRIKSIIFLLASIMVMTSAISQRGKIKRDDYFAFHEFAKLRQMYKQLPIELEIHIQNSAKPFTTEQDTTQSDMSVYIDTFNFFMETEGLEEIVNDSLIVMINNPAKQILVYSNDKQKKREMEKSLSMMPSDSTLETLSKKYVSEIVDTGENIKKIKLKTKELVNGNPKENVSIIYNSFFYEPIEIKQTKIYLVPADSSVYVNLANDKPNDAKLISTSTKQGKIFFLVKELTTTYNFRKISHHGLHPPVKEQDRITKTEDGNYVPAKGYEEYLLTKEF